LPDQRRVGAAAKRWKGDVKGLFVGRWVEMRNFFPFARIMLFC
jgi:hypothetical protein